MPNISGVALWSWLLLFHQGAQGSASHAPRHLQRQQGQSLRRPTYRRKLRGGISVDEKYLVKFKEENDNKGYRWMTASLNATELQTVLRDDRVFLVEAVRFDLSVDR